jgi:D-alanyl-D-alanine carboxypeptidase
MPPYDIETTEWNLSQGWAGGGLSRPSMTCTASSAHWLGYGSSAGQKRFQMQETVPSQIIDKEGYDPGPIGLSGQVRGHGGQSLGFISALGSDAESGVSFVTWGISAGNPVGMIAPDLIDVLRRVGGVGGKDTA